MFDFFPKRCIFLCFILFSPLVFSQDAEPSHKETTHWIGSAGKRLHQIWTEGQVDYFAALYSWHNRYFYSPERVKKYNELAIGTGLGKSLLDEQGNLHGLYAFAFLDSHTKMEPIAGYGYLKTFGLNESIRPGLGFTAFLTARPDILKGNPFPGALPLASISIKKFTLFATYIPGHQDVGNVLFIFAKYIISD